MENFGGSALNAARRPRSATLRRPRADAQLILEPREASQSSSASSRKLSPYDSEGVVLKGAHGFDQRYYSDGVLAPGKRRSESEVREGFQTQSSSTDGSVEKSGDGYSTYQPEEVPNATSEHRLRKVKLKVGGVTRTIHAKSGIHADDIGPSSAKPPRSSDPYRPRLKIISKDYSERGNALHSDTSSSRLSHGEKNDLTDEFNHGKSSSEPTRKSKRIPKKRIFDDDEDEEEARSIEKPKTFKFTADHHPGEYDEDEGVVVKKRKLSNLSKGRSTVYEVDEDYVSRSSKDRKRLKSGKGSEDTYYAEEELGTNVGPEEKKKKSNIWELPAEGRTEPLTTRQRALQSGRGGNGESLVEFPDGLPPKAKDKLSEVEKQAKKAEAAQRRKLQVEKQARETEASAIRKILGYDSEKKKEEKKQKELKKAKDAESKILRPSTIRWVLGPHGKIVTFADDIGLPSIFSSNSCSYPPQREKCAVPSCTNPYRYRDSKSRLPLCSLECYKAVQGKMEPLTL